MCGRYGRVHDQDDLALLAEYHRVKAYVKERETERRQGHYNVRPTTIQPIALVQEGEGRLIEAEWGWRRPWMKPPLINCRGEEAAAKKTWSAPLLTERIAQSDDRLCDRRKQRSNRSDDCCGLRRLLFGTTAAFHPATIRGTRGQDYLGLVAQGRRRLAIALCAATEHQLRSRNCPPQPFTSFLKAGAASA